MYVSVQSTCHLVEASRALYTAYVIVTFGHTCKNMNEEGIQYCYKEKGSRHYFTLKKERKEGRKDPLIPTQKKFPTPRLGHTGTTTRAAEVLIIIHTYSPASTSWGSAFPTPLPFPAPPRPAQMAQRSPYSEGPRDKGDRENNKGRRMRYG